MSKKEQTALEKYYGKFNEDHRLTTRHGQVEFSTSMKHIHSFIKEGEKIKILDVGAGTGRYSIALAREGHIVTAVEPVKKNLDILLSRHENVNCWPGDARNMCFLEDETFDITLMFGPMYHLHGEEERVKALKEACRVTKKGGLIFIAYIMNEYSLISYVFGKNKIKEVENKNLLDKDTFHLKDCDNELYTYLRLEDIENTNKKAGGVERIKIFAPDGPADYMRQTLNAMDEDDFNRFLDFQFSVSERPDLLGASSHTVDVLRRL